ncbi:MAG: PorT family protein [Bacteroidales bacterium]|nr:PorT family protein [Bacteroidales bacterium]
MKKLFLIIAVALISMSASAQKIGVVGGITGLSGSKIGAFSQYHAGIVANFPVAESIFHLQPELVYKVKGGAVENIGSETEKIDLSVGFLEFGLESQLGFGVDKFRVFGLAEPFIGYNINDKFDFKGKDLVDNLSWSKVEYGLAVGGGVELLNFLQASVKYFWNMGSVDVKDGSNKIVSDGKVRNFNGVTLSLAILF